MDYQSGPEPHPDETPTAPGTYQEPEPWQPLQYPYPPAPPTPSPYDPYPPQYQPPYPPHGSPYVAPPVTPGPWTSQDLEQQASPKRGGRSKVWLIVGAGALAVACCLLVLAVVVIGAPLARISAVATSTAAAKATEQTNLVRAQAYITLITPRIDETQADFQKVAAACQADIVAACKADNQTVHRDALAFRAFLNLHQPPACLDTADKELRAGLTEYINGSALIVQGFDENEVDKIDTGSADYTRGDTDIQQAGSAISLASTTC